MSWDLTLVDKISGLPLEANKIHNLKGGTYPLNGTKELTLNVTYNYGPIFKKVFGEKGIGILSGLGGRESQKYISNAIKELNADELDDDYWKPTEGNVVNALYDLLELSQLGPEGIWVIE